MPGLSFSAPPRSGGQRRLNVGAVGLISLAMIVAMALAGRIASVSAGSVLIHVNGESGDDNAACGGSAHPCKTIGFAVDKAVDGDSVIVAPGTYKESVALTKSITLASTRGPAKTTIDATGEMNGSWSRHRA